MEGEVLVDRPSASSSGVRVAADASSHFRLVITPSRDRSPRCKFGIHFTRMRFRSDVNTNYDLRRVYTDCALEMNKSLLASLTLKIWSPFSDRRHFMGREGGMTTTVWRPRVRIAVTDIDGTNVDEKRREESTTKGTKRKRAPPTKGPCEHGVKPRSKCKVCIACPHGRRRYDCKDCGGGAICEHGRVRSKCKDCGGSHICEHGRRRHECKECGGASICEHGRRRSTCKECGGSAICEHGRQRSQCKECGGASVLDPSQRGHVPLASLVLQPMSHQKP
jgi:hypothetical protein